MTTVSVKWTDKNKSNERSYSFELKHEDPKELYSKLEDIIEKTIEDDKEENK